MKQTTADLRDRRRKSESRSQVLLDGDVAYITLTRGRVAVIDAADAEAAGQHLWRFREPGYACRQVSRREVGLHRFLLNPGPHEYVDHIDRDGLNNRKENLRLCTKAQNARNAKQKARSTPATSKYKGVSRLSDRPGWRASIGVDGTVIYLGTYTQEDLAARVYDRAARQHFGEFARTNFPDGA